MGLLSRIGKPGESVRLLAFSDDFRAFEIKKGWTKYGKYIENTSLMEGVELNVSGPLLEKSGERVKGVVYPVDYDKGQGIAFEAPKSPPASTKTEKVRYRLENGQLIPDPNGDIEKTYITEVYPGVPIEIRQGLISRILNRPAPAVKSTAFVRTIKFDITEDRVKIKTNPKLIGHTVASEILSNAIRLKPMRWQLIALFLVGCMTGWLFAGG